MTPSVVSATGQEYARDGGVKGQERLALPGQAMEAVARWATPSQRDGDPRRAPTRPDSNAWANKVARGAVNAAGMLSDDLSSSAAAWNQWPTPRSSDGPKGGPNQAGSKGDLMLPSAAAQWPTPTATDCEQAGSAKAGHFTLNRAGTTWPTPNSAVVEAKSKPPIIGNRKATDPQISTADVAVHLFSSLQDRPTPAGPESSPAGPTSRRRLNPAFGCWLMGWPCWWTNPAITSCARSEMESYRSRLRSQLSSLLGEQDSSEVPHDRP